MIRGGSHLQGLAIFACASALIACGSGTIELSDADSGKTVSASVGQELDITLHTIGPGQYGTPSVSSAAVRFSKVSFPMGQNPGGPTQLFQFEAVAHGTARIEITHTDNNSVFVVTIDVD